MNYAYLSNHLPGTDRFCTACSTLLLLHVYRIWKIFGCLYMYYTNIHSNMKEVYKYHCCFQLKKSWGKCNNSQTSKWASLWLYMCIYGIGHSKTLLSYSFPFSFAWSMKFFTYPQIKIFIYLVKMYRLLTR